MISEVIFHHILYLTDKGIVRLIEYCPGCNEGDRGSGCIGGVSIVSWVTFIWKVG